MRVRVHQPWQQRGVAEVDDFGAGGNGRAAADRGDLVVRDDYNARRDDGGGFAVVEARGFEHDDAIGGEYSRGGDEKNNEKAHGLEGKGL